MSVEVQEKMKQLQIVGCSSQGHFSDQEKLSQLEFIEKMIQKRKSSGCS